MQWGWCLQAGALGTILRITLQMGWEDQTSLCTDQASLTQDDSLI